jgi:predicted dehydrogenase
MGELTTRDGPIGWGIIGCGVVGADGFASDLRSLPEAPLVAVTSRSEERAQRFAARHGALRCHARVEDLVSDPLVDVVYVATPNHRHLPDSLLCLANGKPVLCEKPFAIDGDRGRRDRRRGTPHAACSAWRRCGCGSSPVVREAVDLIREVRSARSARCRPTSASTSPSSPTSRLFDPSMGGGALLDLGVYAVSLADLLLGPPEHVAATSVMAPTGVDEHVAVTTTHAGGVLATSTASIRAVGPNRAVVAGSKGTMIVHGPICRPRRLTVTTHGAASSRARRLLRAVAPAERTVASAGRLHRGNGYDGEAIEVIRCLRAGLIESPSMPLAASLRVMGVIDEARARART